MWQDIVCDRNLNREEKGRGGEAIRDGQTIRKWEISNFERARENGTIFTRIIRSVYFASDVD